MQSSIYEENRNQDQDKRQILKWVCFLAKFIIFPSQQEKKKFCHTFLTSSNYYFYSLA